MIRRMRFLKISDKPERWMLREASAIDKLEPYAL